MAATEYPRYKMADVKKWLAKVFGKEILFESQESLRWHERDPKDDAGAWHLYYTGDIFLRMDLPPLLESHFAHTLQRKLGYAIGESIDKDFWSKNRAQQEEILRNTDWPQPSEVVRDSCWINTGKLRDVAKRLTKPAEWMEEIVNEMLAHEAAWIERKQSVASVCNELFLGHKTQSIFRKAPQFRYSTRSGNLSGLEVSCVIAEYQSPLPGDAYASSIQWRQRNHEVGLEGMMAYEFFSIGTHAPIEEFKFALYGRSDMEIANQLETLRKPEKLVTVRKYIHEVIAETSIKHWLSERYHPDFSNELQEAWKAMPTGLSEKKQEAWAKSQEEAISAMPKHRQWKIVFPQLAQDHPTTGAFIQAIYREPPAGHEETYAYLRRWSESMFPLLKSQLGITEQPTPHRPEKIDIGRKIECFLRH